MNLKHKICTVFLALILAPASSFAFDREHERQAKQQAYRHAEWHRQAQHMHPCYYDRRACRPRHDNDILLPMVILGTAILIANEAEKERRREESRQYCRQIPVLNQDGEIVAYRQVCN